jgi:hypothetical protein
MPPKFLLLLTHWSSVQLPAWDRCRTRARRHLRGGHEGVQEMESQTYISSNTWLMYCLLLVFGRCQLKQRACSARRWHTCRPNMSLVDLVTNWLSRWHTCRPNTPLVSAQVLVYASAPREAAGADVANMAFYRQRQTFALAHRMHGKKQLTEDQTVRRNRNLRRNV